MVFDMNKDKEHLLLKWGTLKGWSFPDNDKAVELLKKYHEHPVSMSVMAQHDTSEQKEILCRLIDVCNGPIQNDWDGKVYTKEQAKEYILNYGK